MSLANHHALPFPDSLDACERECQRLRQLLDAYQTFVGHDLPNQLLSVQAFARLIEELDGLRLDDESKRLLSRIGSLSKKMGVQTRHLFSIGKLLQESPWGPPSVVQDAVEEVIAAIRFRMEVSKTAFILRGCDLALPFAKPLLGQVLMELLTNAVAAIGVGQIGSVEVSSQETSSGSLLRVRDTGVGISPDRLDALSRTTHVGGLLVVRQAAALWGGRLDMDSVVGRGTVMTVTMATPIGGR